jgi:hypothetical protein
MTKADKISVTLLDVGQGSSAFVAIYTGGTKITATALLDLGSERAKSEAGLPAVTYIETQLNSMTKPRIDFFSLSHSDSDHINLVQELLARFDKPGTKKPTKPILEIGTVIYGGPRVEYAKHSSNNVISDVEGYQPTGEKKPDPLPANNCSYSTTTPMKDIDEVRFSLLVGNHIRGEARTYYKRIGKKQWRTDSYSLNTYSLIFVITYDGWNYVITGDATGATIQQANFFITKYSTKFSNVAVMTMPHHSSETTTFGLSGPKRARAGLRVSNDAKKVIETFSKSVAPQSINASAEEVASFRHPSAYTMSYFWDHVRKTGWYDDPLLTGNQHLYNAYFDTADGYEVVNDKAKKTKEPLPPFDDWWTLGTQYAIFTNRYYVRPQAFEPDTDKTATFPPNPGELTGIPASGATTVPPFAVAWQYTSTAATNKTEIVRLTNRATGTSRFTETPVMAFTKDAPRDAAPAADAPAPRAAGGPHRRLPAPPLQAPARCAPSPRGTPKDAPALRRMSLRRMRLRDG